MTKPIGLGPFRPVGDRLPDRFVKQVEAGAGALPAGMLAGRGIRRVDAAALAGPAGAALAAAGRMAGGTGSAGPVPACPLSARSVRLGPSSGGGAVPEGPAAAGNRVLTLLRSASAVADGALFRQAAERARIDPVLMAPGRREAVDALVAAVPLPPWSPAVAGAVLADALDSALRAVMDPRDGSPGGINGRVAAGAAARARIAVESGDGDAAVWVADAVARRALLGAGGGAASTDEGIGRLVEAVLAPGEGAGEAFRAEGKPSMFPMEGVREEVQRFMRHFGQAH